MRPEEFGILRLATDYKAQHIHHSPHPSYVFHSFGRSKGAGRARRIMYQLSCHRLVASINNARACQCLPKVVAEVDKSARFDPDMTLICVQSSPYAVICIQIKFPPDANQSKAVSHLYICTEQARFRQYSGWPWLFFAHQMDGLFCRRTFKTTYKNMFRLVGTPTDLAVAAGRALPVQGART